MIENPPTVASPEVGSRIPQSIFIVVDLPAPLAPRNPNISPLRTSNETLSTEVKSPKFFVRFFTSIEYSEIVFSVKLIFFLMLFF